MRCEEVVPTEAGAHTLALDPEEEQNLFVPAAIASCRGICRYDLIEARCQHHFSSLIGHLGQVRLAIDYSV
jgi:hypothetical protein